MAEGNKLALGSVLFAHSTPGTVLTFTGPALMELKRKDDVILILTELTDEALGLAELGRKRTGSKIRGSIPGTGTRG